MENKNYLNTRNALKRWVMLTCLMVAGVFMNSFGQNVNVTGAAAGNGTYPTLGAAFTAISPPNVNTGAVIGVSIVAGTTETATAVLGAGAWASVTVTCTTPVVVTGSLTTTALIKLNGADNVTIDGRIAGAGNNITITNTGIGTNTTGIWLASAGVGAGCLNNVVRNCNISCGADQSTGTVVTFGIIMNGASISATTNGDDNDNNSFLFNNITKVRFGIVTRGVTTSNNFNINVSNNIIGPSSFGSNEIGLVGIFMQADSLSTVSNNTVQFVGGALANTTSGADRIGIGIGTNSWSNTATTTITSGGYTVTGNIVHDIIEERTFSSVGILVGTTRSGTATNNLIANNFIYNVRANGTSGDCASGIGHVGSRGDKIVFNSILMTGDLDPAGATGVSTTPSAAGITKHLGATADTAVTIKNNIIYLDVNCNASLNGACIITPTPPYAWGSGGMNNNDYYFPPANTAMRTGGTGTSTVTFFATLANWQGAYSPAQDGASISTDPTYASATDLHASALALNGAAVPIAGVTTDIDGQTRDVSTPDIGADEFTPPAGVNMGATALVAPAVSGCRTATEAVTVTIKNYGIATIDFSVNNVTVNATATGPNSYSSSTVLTTGTLATNATMNVTLPATFDMTAPGTYTFNANTSVTGDLNPANDAMAPANRVSASLGGTYTVGTGGNFTTLTAAAAAFNAASCFTSSVVFSLINTSYPSETFPITFNSNGAQGTNTVTIKPTLAGTTISGSSASGAIINLNGADYFIIDGSTSSTVNSLCPPVTSASRDLTITNTSASTAATVILLGSVGAGQGATNNIIKNCNIAGGADQSTSTTDTYGIGVFGNVLVSPPWVDGADNNNNTIENNSITKVRWGIIFRGTAASSNTNNIIRQNIVGPAAFGTDQIGKVGILIQNQDLCTVTGNEVRNLGVLISQTASGTDRIGIGVGGLDGPSPTATNVTNSIITKNNIHDIIEEKTFSSIGMMVAGSGTPSNNVIANNFINNVRANATSPDNGLGIAISAGNGDKVSFNTINMFGDMDPGVSTTATQSSAGIRIVSTTPTNLTLKDNLISVDLTSNTSTLKQYAVIAPSTAYAWGTGGSNNNDYYTNASNTQMVLGGIGTSNPYTDVTTLASWKTQFTPNQDAASVVVQPVYTSATDLHLIASSNPSLDGAGSPVAGVTDDYDCETRNLTIPDIGADEFAPAVCVTANGGSATGSTSFCGSGTPAITASGYSTGTGTTYQWIFSTNIGDYPSAGSPVGGQTNPALLTTGAVSTTTYFWLRVTCATDVSTANSNMITVTVNPSVASITPASVTMCAGQSALLTENGGTGTSWLWSTGATTASISVSPASTTTYTVTVTSPGPCTTTASRTVNITSAPTNVTASASGTFICAGTAINLTSSADSPSPNILSEDFNTGAPSWTRINTSTGGTPADAAWTNRPSPYAYAGTLTVTFNSNDVTQFVLTNSDDQGSGAITATILQSPAFSTMGYSSCNLSFFHIYKDIADAGDNGYVEASTNGTTWTNVTTYTTNQGSESAFASASLSLNAFLNQPTVYVRFRYEGTWDWWWAIDNVSITGTPPSYTYSWTSTPAGYTSNQQNPLNVTPSVSTTYTVAVSNGSCSASASTAQVVVNPNPVISIASQTDVSCNGANDASVDLDASSGTSPFLFDLDGSNTTDGIYTNLGPGSYLASVIDDNGCESGQITVTITEPPLLTLSASSNTPACSGGTLNLTSTPGGGTPNYNYSWSGPNSFTATSQNPSISSVTSAATGTYTVTVTDDNGCSETTTTNVTVNTSPTASIANFGSNNICLSQPATVTLAFTGSGPWNYTVSDGTQNVSGSTGVTPVNINITPTTAGTHNYTVTVVSDVNCTGTSTGTATVFVSTAPPTNNVGTPNGPTEACSGTVSLITVNVVGGTNIRYSWNTGSNSSVVLFSTNIGGPFSPGPFQTLTNQVYAQFGALSGSSGYQVCVQGVNGCGSTNNKCLSIRGTVSVPGTITPPSGAVACPNDVKSYACGASGGATVYNWTLGGSATPITSGQGTTSVQVTFPAAFTSGQLCVTAALSCGGSSTSAPRCMTISKNPAVPAAMTAGPSSVCPGATGVVFTVPAVTGATGYSWTTPAGTTITSGQNTPSITVNFPAVYTGAPPVCVSATSACGTSAARCKTVGSNIPGQPGSVTGPTTNICNSTVQYSISNVAGATSYLWTNPAGTTITSGQGSTTILLSVSSAFNTGSLTVTANTSLCTPGSSVPRTITINGKPNVPASITANPTSWCNGGFVNFSAPIVTPAVNYNWAVSTGTITAGQGTNNIDVTWGTGTGNVTVNATNTCGASSNKVQSFSSVCREEGELRANAQLNVYPNPAHDKVTVSIDITEDTDLTLQLMDVSGRVVLSESLTGTAGMNTYNLNLIHLSKGVYMLEVNSGTESWKAKVAVE